MGSVVGLATLLAVQTANAQPRWGKPRAPQSGACFYRDMNFRGSYFCAGVGEDIAMLSRGMTDQISSIRTFGNAEVEVFQTDGFVGRSAVFENDVQNLMSAGWNDQLSSLRVGRAGRYGRGMNDARGGRNAASADRNDGDERYGAPIGRNDASVRRERAEGEIDAQPRWGNQRAPQSGACFYRDLDFQGPYFCAGVGEEIAFLSQGMNDPVSSIRTFGNAEVEVFQAVRYRGRSAWFGNDVPDLRAAGWNDQLSSLRVGRAGNYGRDMTEPRGGRNGTNRSTGIRRTEREPDATVRRVYQDILNREPDPTGMGIYRNRMLNDGWSEQQVRAALLQSPEYRDQNVMTREKAAEIVARVYRSELNREPGDAAQGWVDKVLKENWNEATLAIEIRKSPEYRDRNVMTREKAAEIVARVYRSELNREPGAAAQGWVDKVFNENWSEATLAIEIRKSDEYRNKR